MKLTPDAIQSLVNAALDPEGHDRKARVQAFEALSKTLQTKTTDVEIELSSDPDLWTAQYDAYTLCPMGVARPLGLAYEAPYDWSDDDQADSCRIYLVDDVEEDADDRGHGWPLGREVTSFMAPYAIGRSGLQALRFALVDGYHVDWSRVFYNAEETERAKRATAAVRATVEAWREETKRWARWAGHGR
jgi:hypothetical protein